MSERKARALHEARCLVLCHRCICAACEDRIAAVILAAEERGKREAAIKAIWIAESRVWPIREGREGMSESRISELEAALAAKDAELEELRDPLYCPVCGSCGEPGCCGTKRCKYLDQHQGDYDDLVKDNDALRQRSESATEEIASLKRELSEALKLLRAIYLDSTRTGEWWVPADVQECVVKMFGEYATEAPAEHEKEQSGAVTSEEKRP